MASVFIIESDLEFASALNEALASGGHQSRVLEDGNLAVEEAAKAPPDVVVLCAELPKLSGFSVCNRLKRDPKLQAVPVIMISANASEETFEQHRRLPKKSAQAYVHKPIAVDDMVREILDVLGSSGAMVKAAPVKAAAVAAAPISDRAPKRNPFESGVVLEPGRAADNDDDLDALLDVSLDEVLIDEELMQAPASDTAAVAPAPMASEAERPAPESQRSKFDAKLAELDKQRVALETEVQQLKHQVSGAQQDARNKSVAAETALETCAMLESEIASLKAKLLEAEKTGAAQSERTQRLASAEAQAKEAEGAIVELEGRERELADRLAHKEAELRDASDALRAQSGSADAERTGVRDALERLQARCAELEVERDSARIEANKAHASSASQQADIARLGAELAEALQEMKSASAEATRLADELANGSVTHAQATESLRHRAAKELAQLSKDLKTSHTAELEHLGADKAAALQQVREEGAAAVAQVRAESDAARDQARAESDAARDQARAESDAALERLRTETAATTEQLRIDSGVQLAERDHHLRTATEERDALRQSQATLEHNLANLSAEHIALVEVRTNLEQALASLGGERDHLLQGKAELEQGLAVLAQERDALRQTKVELEQGLGLLTQERDALLQTKVELEQGVIKLVHERDAVSQQRAELEHGMAVLAQDRDALAHANTSLEQELGDRRAALLELEAQRSRVVGVLAGLVDALNGAPRE